MKAAVFGASSAETETLPNPGTGNHHPPGKVGLSAQMAGSRYLLAVWREPVAGNGAIHLSERFGRALRPVDAAE